MAMDLDEVNLDKELADIAAKSKLDDEAIDTLRRLADASRTSIAVRKGLANHNVLGVLLRTAEGGRGMAKSSQALDTQILRCVGNSCASNPHGIVAVTELGLEWLHPYLTLDSSCELRSLAVRVLYNICAVDFEGDEEIVAKENPALPKLYQQNFHIDLIHILVGLQPEHPDVELLVDALFWISSAASSSPPQPPNEALWRLLDTQWCDAYLHRADTEVLASLIESTVSLCRPQTVCKTIVAEGRTVDVMRYLALLNARLDPSGQTAGVQTDPDVQALLVPQASALIWLLSDISAETSFGQAQRLHDPTIRSVLSVLETPSAPDRTLMAACIVLGNALLNLPEDDTESLVHDGVVLRSILDAALRPDASPDLLHAIASLLIVLCKPSKVVREKIAEIDQAVPAVEKLCRHSTPQVRDAGIKALKAIGRDSESVQQRFASLAQSLQPVEQSQDTMEQ